MMRRYLRDRLKAILFALAVISIFLITAILYQQMMPAVLYASLLSLLLGMILLAAGYPRYARRMRYLLEMRSCGELEGCADHLPQAASAEIAVYQELLRSLSASYRQHISEEDEKYQDRSDCFAMWAHQIKTPIAAMHLLIDDQDLPEVKDQLFRIEEYVSMVMHYLRADNISRDFVLKSYEIDPIVEEAVRHYSSLFIRRHLKLEYSHVNLQVTTDRKWLLFVIEQLLSNALKYTSRGSISIFAEQDCLVIADTGCGIAAEDLPRLFDKGYTGYNGRMDKGSTGLGLYLCRKVMDQLGHTIRIESEAGRGTRVLLGLNLSKR